jgi:hypothetical protein
MTQGFAPLGRRDAHFKVISALAGLLLLGCFGTSLIAQNSGETFSSTIDFPKRVTHVLGLEGISNNARGNLSIRGGALQFQRSEGPAAPIDLNSIQSVFLGEQDKQVGGVPMTLVQAATPYSGGRVIALFSHKKYDPLTVEYRDSNGGLHGAIFQMSKGQGRVLKSELMAGAAHQ